MKSSNTDLKFVDKFSQYKRMLVYGYGNPGRQDDGLGYHFVKEFEQEKIPNLYFDFNYQLNIEDASSIADYDIVVFVDASLRIEDEFLFRPLYPNEDFGHSTHALSAQAILHICKQFYGKIPESYLLEIHGHEWELEEGLTFLSKKALAKAIHFFKEYLCRSFFTTISIFF